MANLKIPPWALSLSRYDETMNESKIGMPGPVHKTPTDLRMALARKRRRRRLGGI